MGLVLLLRYQYVIHRERERTMTKPCSVSSETILQLLSNNVIESVNSGYVSKTTEATFKRE